MEGQGAAGGERVDLGADLYGILFRPETEEARPCVILLHERYGLVKHTLDLAARLARDGYAAFAPDVMARCPDQEALHRGEITVDLHDDQVCADLEASVAMLRDRPGVDAGRLAVMGVCQSGRYPLVFGARHPIRAAVTFYGGAQAREWPPNERQPQPFDDVLARLGCPVLGVFGEADHVIPVDDVLRLRNALERHRKSYDIRIYAGAPHGWLNDTMPGRYRPELAEAAWRHLLAFLALHLAPVPVSERVRWRFESDTATDYDHSRNVRYE